MSTGISRICVNDKKKLVQLLWLKNSPKWNIANIQHMNVTLFILVSGGFGHSVVFQANWSETMSDPFVMLLLCCPWGIR